MKVCRNPVTKKTMGSMIDWFLGGDTKEYAVPAIISDVSQEFSKEVSDVMHAAAVQYVGVGSDGTPSGKLVNPTFALSGDIWPPRFKKGVNVEFAYCGSEAVLPGDFVVVRRGVKLSVCRVVDWHYDGQRVTVYVLRTPRDRKATPLQKNEPLLGVVVTVTPAGKSEAYKPNERTWWAGAYGAITKFGTCNPLKGMCYLAKEAWLVLRTKRADRPKQLGFWQSIRTVNQWCVQAVEREAQEAVAKAIKEEEQALKHAQALKEAETTKPIEWWKG